MPHIEEGEESDDSDDFMIFGKSPVQNQRKGNFPQSQPIEQRIGGTGYGLPRREVGLSGDSNRASWNHPSNQRIQKRFGAPLRDESEMTSESGESGPRDSIRNSIPDALNMSGRSIGSLGTPQKRRQARRKFGYQ